MSLTSGEPTDASQPTAGPTLRYARDGRSWSWNWMNAAALACLPLLVLAFLCLPGIFTVWIYSRRRDLALAALVVSAATALPILLAIGANRRSRRLRGISDPLMRLVVAAALMNVVATPFLVEIATDRVWRDRAISHSWVKCSSNLRQIAQGILLYSNDHQGHFPPTLMDAVISGDLELDALVCPFSDDTRAASVAQLREGGHISYVYLGKGMTTASATAETVIAYDHPTNHASVELDLHVLYGDGHVDHVSEPRLREIIRDIEAGRNPPGPGS